MRGQKEGEQGRVGKNVVNSQWGRCWRKSGVDGNVSNGSESERVVRVNGPRADVGSVGRAVQVGTWSLARTLAVSGAE